MKLNDTIRSTMLPESVVQAFRSDSQDWLKQFLNIYQTKNITPYIHALVAHVPQFMEIHGGIVVFTQQDLEKLNNDMTKFYFRGSNHRDKEALQQMLLKKNRITYLFDSGCRRPRLKQVCSLRAEQGHNRKTCRLQAD